MTESTRTRRRTVRQREFDDATLDWPRWPEAECRNRIGKLRKMAANFRDEDSRFDVLREIAKKGEHKWPRFGS
jgi:hypothetical protein